MLCIILGCITTNVEETPINNGSTTTNPIENSARGYDVEDIEYYLPGFKQAYKIAGTKINDPVLIKAGFKPSNTFLFASKNMKTFIKISYGSKKKGIVSTKIGSLKELGYPQKLLENWYKPIKKDLKINTNSQTALNEVFKTTLIKCLKIKDIKKISLNGFVRPVEKKQPSWEFFIDNNVEVVHFYVDASTGKLYYAIRQVLSPKCIDTEDDFESFFCCKCINAYPGCKNETTIVKTRRVKWYVNKTLEECLELNWRKYRTRYLNCIVNNAIKENDSNICEKMNTPNGRDNCLKEVGKALNDISICRQIKKPLTKRECILNYN